MGSTDLRNEFDVLNYDIEIWNKIISIKSFNCKFQVLQIYL